MLRGDVSHTSDETSVSDTFCPLQAAFLSEHISAFFVGLLGMLSTTLSRAAARDLRRGPSYLQISARQLRSAAESNRAAPCARRRAEVLRCLFLSRLLKKRAEVLRCLAVHVRGRGRRSDTLCHARTQGQRDRSHGSGRESQTRDGFWNGQYSKGVLAYVMERLPCPEKTWRKMWKR